MPRIRWLLKIGLELSVEHYLHNWLPPLDTLLLPHTAFYRALPFLQPKGSRSEDGSGFSGTLGAFTHSAARLWWSSRSSHPAVCCCRDWAQHARAQPLVSPTTLLTSNNFLSWERILDRQRHFSSILCLGFQWEGSPEQHGGCWFAWWAARNRAGVLHMVCHSFPCLSLPMQIVCTSPWSVGDRISPG